MARPKKKFPPLVSSKNGSERVWWNGRYHTLGPAGSDKARQTYARLIAVWAVDPTAHIHRTNELLVSTLCMEYMQSDASPDEGSGNRTRFRLAFLRLMDHAGGMAVEEFGATEFEAWQKWMCGLRNLDGSPRFNRTSVAANMACVRRLFRWAAKTKRVGWDRVHELASVEPPKPGRVREPVPTPAANPAHVAATLPFLRGPVQAMVELQLITGARPGELFKITPAGVLRGGRVEIPGVGLVDLEKEGVWVFAPSHHKTARKGKFRWVVFGAKAKAILAPFLDRPADRPCFSPAESLAELRNEQRTERDTRGGGSGGNRKLRVKKARRQPGESYRRDSYCRAIKRACVKAGVPEWFPYQLRHLAAEEVDFALGLDAAQAVLGHSSPNTTRRYAKRAFRTAVEAAQKIG